MDDFETAILYSYDPSVGGVIKEKAIAFCDRVRNTADAWKFCLDKFFNTNVIQVKFFCLQVLQDLILHRYTTITDSDRANLKASLLSWCTEFLPSRQEDSSIKNKYAQIIVLLFKAEYPDVWPSFFHDMLATLSRGPTMIDIFLRILKTIDEEVVSPEVHRSPAELAHSARIKDAMRERAVVDLANVWYEVLTCYENSSAVLVNMCLQNIKSYVGWIDITLILNPKFMSLFFKLLSHANYREEVCGCLYEIVSKGMDPVAKLSLLKQLDLKSIISASATNDTVFLVKLGKLVNTVGSELLDCIANSSTPQLMAGAGGVGLDSMMLDDFLGLLFKFMNSETDEVASSVLGFAGLYINRIKQAKQAGQPVSADHLQLLLQIIRNKMKYPVGFDFDVQDEEEETFIDLRRELSNIYRNIFRIAPDMVSTFVQSTLTTVNTSPPAPFPEAEVALYLFYQVGEGLSSTGEETAKAMEFFFAQTVMFLASSSLSSHPHQIVTLMYFENVVRYAKNFPPTQPQYLVAVLAAFLDSRGIRHAQWVVRRRVCYLFRQFVKAVKGQLFPYLDNIVESLKELLAISYEVQKSVPFDDQVNFYESLGVLIGSNTDLTQQQKHTEALIQPALAQLEQIIAKELYKTDNPEKPYYSVILVQLVTVIGSFSKGFTPISSKGDPSLSPSPNHNSTSNTMANGTANAGNISGGNPTSPQRQAPSQHVQQQALLTPARTYFLKALNSVLRIPTALPAHDELREKVFFFMHRMVDVLGPNIFPVLPTSLALLLNNTNRIKDSIEYITLVNQLISRFKEAILNLINDMLMPTISRIFEMLNPATPPTPNSEEQREVMELQKHYYLFLQNIFSNNIAGVFTSPSNAGKLQQILETVAQGCIPTVTDMGIPKICISILRRMIEEWGAIDTFNSFLYERVVPRLFELPLSPSFDPNDALSNALVMEVAKLQKLIVGKRGPEFLTFLGQVFLPSMGCSPDLIQQYIHHLDKSQIKQFQDFFKNFVRAKRA